MDRGPEESAKVSAKGKRPDGSGGGPAGDDSWLQTLAQISPVAIFRSDAVGRCVYVNGHWSELTGISEAEALGEGWVNGLHPEDAPRVVAEWRRACAEGRNFRMEYRYRRADGRVCWVFGQARELRNAQGRITGYIGVAMDITELRAMREELQRSQAALEERVRERTAQWEHMALIVAASLDGIISSDLAGCIVSWNAAAERIFGYTADEMIGRTTFELTPPERIEEAKKLKRQVQGGKRVDSFETVRMARSGELIEVELSLFPLRNAAGKIVGTSAIVRDVREKKMAERRLRQLSGRLLQVQDEERRRLARELHDSTAQSLGALTVNLSLLTGRAADLAAQKRAELLTESLALAESIARELRTHAYLLHPPLLDERGLPAALRWLAEGLAARSGLAIDVKVAANLGRLPEAVERTIFRIAQESLANVHRHAKSPTAGLRLRRKKGGLELEVRDAGCGLPRKVSGRVGVGIAGMRERVAQLGGTLEIRSDAGGTIVTARIP